MNGIEEYSDIGDDLKFVNKAIKRTTFSVVKALPTIIAVFTVITIILTVWLKISIEDIFSLNFAASMLFFTALYLILYYSLGENGTRAGKEDGMYIKTSDKHRDTCYRLREEKKLDRLGEYCEKYAKDEIEQARKRIMLNSSIPYDEYAEKWLPLGSEAAFALNGKILDIAQKHGKITIANIPILTDMLKLPLKKRKAIIMANRMKPIELSPELILCNEKEHIGRNPIAPSTEKMLKRRDRINIIPLIAFTFISASFVMEIVREPSLARFVYGMVKAITGVWIGFKGYTAHYLVYSVDAVAFHESQLNVISGYEQWLEQEKCIK